MFIDPKIKHQIYKIFSINHQNKLAIQNKTWQFDID